MKLNPVPSDSRLEAADLIRTGRRLGHTVAVLAETGSTNDELRAKAEAGAPEGLVIVAEAQTRGRGRLERRWESPPGKNLLLSVLLRPGLPVEQSFQVTLMAGVAVARTLERSFGLKPRIKWPNDVMLRERKVCGILAEMQAKAGRVEYLILGLGVNLNLLPEDLPEELRPVATSVSEELGHPVSRTKFARELLEGLDNLYQDLLNGGWPRILESWQAGAAIQGQEVTVQVSEGVIRGTALGLDQDGALRVWDRAGLVERRILAGDVIYAREAPAGAESPFPRKGV